MAITAAMVKELRERTGAGMMECKKALVESQGDMDTAIEHLRKAGLAQAGKKASRVAAEGKIFLAISEDRQKGVLLEVNCETDFVAKDANFLGFAGQVAALALTTRPADIDSLLASQMDAGETVEEARQALVAKIGENVQIRRFVLRQTDGQLGAYVHSGRIGVLVDMDGGDAELAKNISMHVAASQETDYVDVADVPEEYLAKEREIHTAQAADSGKPPEIISKIVEGRLRKRLAEITLLGNPFVMDTDLTVKQLLEQHSARVNGFDRLTVGEGIEKREANFAEEVMQQVQGG